MHWLNCHLHHKKILTYSFDWEVRLLAEYCGCNSQIWFSQKALLISLGLVLCFGIHQGMEWCWVQSLKVFHHHLDFGILVACNYDKIKHDSSTDRNPTYPSSIARRAGFWTPQPATYTAHDGTCFARIRWENLISDRSAPHKHVFTWWGLKS